MLNRDPTRLSERALHDIMSIVHTEAQKHLGLLMNSEESTAKTGLPGTTKSASSQIRNIDMQLASNDEFYETIVGDECSSSTN